MSTFQELGVDVTLTEVLSGRNISSPFEVQVAAIPLMLDGHDVAEDVGQETNTGCA